MNIGAPWSSISSTSSQTLAADAASLARLKFQAAQATPQTIKEVARQFEALFMRELLKSMREASLKSGLLDSPTEDLATDLLDEQLALQMTALPGGLSDIIAKQLMQELGLQDDAPGRNAPAQTSANRAVVGPAGSPATPSANSVGSPVSAWINTPINAAKSAALPGSGTEAAVSLSGQAAAAQDPSSAQPALATSAMSAARSFVRQHAQTAQEVQRSSGLPASYLLGQAGHESGWGRREILLPDGSPSHNLFGIKATASWKGKVAEVSTTEYQNGLASQTLARFRAYDSYAEAMRDFARLVSTSPRYAQAMQQKDTLQGWTQGLQNGGYATDPDYAAKLSRAINTTLQLQRSQG